MPSRLGPAFVLLLACDPTPAPEVRSDVAKSEPARSVAHEPAPAPADTRAVRTSARPTPTPITRDARVAYGKHLAEGRRLAKAQQWAKAIVELEAALAVIPGDDRALAELSWAAFSSGDHAKARTTARAAVLAASNPKLEGAALYNLGRAEEALGDLTAAKAAYEQSVAQRPNEVVQKRLDELATRVPTPTEALACTTPIDASEVCACLLAARPAADPPEFAAPPQCELQPTTVEGFSVARYTMSGLGEENVVLVAQGPKGWSAVEQLDYVYNPGAFGIYEEWELASATERTIAGHAVVEFTSHRSRSDSDMGVDEAESEVTDTQIVCVRGDATTAPRCPLRVMTSYTYERDRMGLAGEGEIASDMQTPGLPIRRETKIAVTIGEDGVARLRAEAGAANPEQLGDRRLW